MTRKHIRTEYGEPIVIQGEKDTYRVMVIRRGRQVEWKVEELQVIDGAEVWVRTKGVNREGYGVSDQFSQEDV